MTSPSTTEPVPATTSAPAAFFADRLAAAIDAVGTPACIGLDPVIDKLPPFLRDNNKLGVADKFEMFCTGVVQACVGVVPVIKLQSACFERYGSNGIRVLKNITRLARRSGLVVILDAKRGDIGISAEHYAAAAFGAGGGGGSGGVGGDEEKNGADAITLSGYLGPDTIEPFLQNPARGVFVLVRTSNPDSDVVQSLKLADGRTIAEMMADMVTQLGSSRLGASGLSNVGAVVGATKAADAAALRQRLPNAFFLIPGYGAQGGTLEDIRLALRPSTSSPRTPSQLGVLVTASRSIIYPAWPAKGATGAIKTWEDAVAAAAKTFANEVRALNG